MATKTQIVYNILNILSAGRIGDDFNPSYQQVSFIIDYYRSLLLRRDFDSNVDVPRQFEQDLGVIPLIPVDKAECGLGTLGCTVLRTSVKIPRPVRFKLHPGITFIGAIDKVTKFDIILPERVPYITYSKYTSTIPRVYYMRDYIYVISEDEMLKYINVRGIWDKPEDAKTFNCDGEACYTDHSEYPITNDFVQMITQSALNGEMKFLLEAGRMDTTNDSQYPNKADS